MPGRERRKQILVTAVRVFARSNYQSARMADIAAEVGVSEAAIYRYFPSKKSIYLEILRHMSRRIVTFWQEEVDGSPDALTALRKMGMTYYRRMMRHPDELKVQFQAVAEVSDPEISTRLHQDHTDYIDFIRGVIRLGQSQGCIRQDLDADTMAWFLDGVGVLFNLTNMLSLKDPFDEATVESLLDHFLESMAAR